MMNQSTPRIRSLLPAIGVLAFATALRAQPGAAPADRSPYKTVIDSNTVVVHQQDRPVLRYRYAQVPFKPYVDFLATPSGINVLRDSPADHKHHHGLMFALSVDRVDFWAELAANGRQAHQGLNDVRVGTGGQVHYAGFAEDLAWVDPAGQTLMLPEGRRIELVSLRDQQATLVTWESFLATPPEKKSLVLSGSEYFGLGMRFVQSMDTGGRFFNADGKTGVEGTNAARSRWCAYTARAGGKPVTVAMFDHPANPRHAATWFTMTDPFAYISVTLNPAKQPLTVAEDRPILLRYGVALWDGTVNAAVIDALFRRWAELFQAPPEAAGGTPPGPAQPGQPQPNPARSPQKPQAAPGR